MTDPQYIYRAIVDDVYDGDTITLSIDLGLYTWVKGVKARLHGIDAPEVRGSERPDGLKARDWLRMELLNQEVVIETIKDKQGKYGRWLVNVYDGGVNINDKLVSLGLAEYKEY